MTDEHRRPKWRWILLRIVWFLIAFLLGGIATSAYQKVIDPTLESTYLRLNWFSLIATIPMSLLIWISTPVILWLLLDFIFQGGRGVFRFYIRLARYMTGRSIRRVWNQSRLLTETTRLTLFLLVGAIIFQFMISALLVNNFSYWTRQRESIETIDTAEELLDETWYFGDTDNRNMTIPFPDSRVGLFPKNGLYKYPRMCASFASPANPGEFYFDFGFQIYSPETDEIVRIGLDSTGSIFLANEIADSWNVNREPLPFYSAEDAGVDLADSQQTPLCAIFTERAVFLYANNRLISMFRMEIDDVHYKCSVFYDAFSEQNAAKLDLWVYQFDVGYRQRSYFATPNRAPAPNPESTPSIASFPNGRSTSKGRRISRLYKDQEMKTETPDLLLLNNHEYL